MRSFLPLCVTGGKHVVAPQLHGEIQDFIPAECMEACRGVRV